MFKKKILKAYETLADGFNAKIDHQPHNAYYDRPNTLALLGKVAGQKILDAACGPGKYAEILMERGAHLTGFDLSPRMIELAKSRNPEQGHFFVHDMSEPLPIEHAQFDKIVCALAMNYLEDWKPTIQEFHRVLKPGGQIVLSMEHPFFDYHYFKAKHYFSIEAVKPVWKGFGPKAVEVPGYRRPLAACIQPLTENGFYIDALVEPLPEEAFSQLDPKHFKELNTFPGFMMIRAVKA